MRVLPLQSKSQSACFFAIVDDEDFERLSSHKWSVSKNCNTYYARRFEGPKGSVKLISMHRVITNAPDDVLIDHRSGQGLDNRKENLRFATHAQNMRNRRIDKRNTTGVTGVYWNKRKSKWQSLIMINGKRKGLGYFRTFDEAVAARKTSENEHYGEFARAA